MTPTVQLVRGSAHTRVERSSLAPGQHTFSVHVLSRSGTWSTLRENIGEDEATILAAVYEAGIKALNASGASLCSICRGYHGREVEHAAE